MAQRIPFRPPVRDPREELIQKLDKAPQEHAEALLDSYDILQLLRDKGILELTKGVLGSGEKVLEVLTKTLETEEAVSLLRNLIILVKLVGGLNPEVLEEVQTALSHSAQRARNEKPPGLFHVLRRLASADSRRALDTLASVTQAVGRNLYKAEEPGLRGEKREMVTRRSVKKVGDEFRRAIGPDRYVSSQRRRA